MAEIKIEKLRGGRFREIRPTPARAAGDAVVQVRLGNQAVEISVSQTTRPRVATMTELGQHAGELITEVQSGVPMFVSKHGRFVAMIVPVDSDDVERVLTETIASARIHDADPTETLARRNGRRVALPVHKLFTAADAAAALGVELPDD